MTRLLLALFAVVVALAFSALLLACIVGGVRVLTMSHRLRRWTQPPPGPEREALDELERLYRMPAFRDKRVR